MSRIGKLPISIPKGVEIKVSDKNLVTVKGPKGTLEQEIDADNRNFFIGFDSIQGVVNDRNHKENRLTL